MRFDRPNVYVEWYDSALHADNSTLDKPLILIKSTGFATRKGHAIVLVSSIREDGEDAPGEPRLSINKHWIKKLHRYSEDGPRIYLTSIPRHPQIQKPKGE